MYYIFFFKNYYFTHYTRLNYSKLTGNKIEIILLGMRNIKYSIVHSYIDTH